MAKLDTITRFLRKDLMINSIDDYSINGTQVKGKNEVKRIAFGVDACMDLFKKARQENCDMIIVHHGIRWKGKKDDVSIKNERIKFLRKHNLTLFAAHLPLDMHPRYGHNIVIANNLGIRNIKPFGLYNKRMIGYYGDLRLSLKQIVNRVNTTLNTVSVVHNFGGKKTRKVGVISGSGSFAVHECAKKGIDTFVTGELSHVSYHYEKESRLNVVFAGHYKSEIVGIKKIAEILKEKFNIETVFFDIPTNI